MRLRKAFPDVPCARLYRHIKISANSSVLEAAGENRIAGGKGRQNAAMREIRAQKTGSDYSRLPKEG